MTADFDTSGLDRLTADLNGVTFAARRTIPTALGRTSMRIKDAWNESLYREGPAKHTGRSISYDITETPDEFTAEIGAERGGGRQAFLTRMLEYGTVHNAPHGGGAAALDANAEDFVRGIERAATDALGDL